MEFYMDYTHSVPDQRVKYHGGGNYTKTILLELIQREDVIIHLICPLTYEPKTDEEKIIFSHPHVDLIRVQSLSDFTDYKPNSMLFLPMPVISLSRYLRSVKKAHQLKIFTTIHGVRRLDLKYDSYDAYYKNRKVWIHFLLNYFPTLMGRFLFIIFLRRYLNVVDRVFTVSNNSLQRILKVKNVDWINYFYYNSGFNPRTKCVEPPIIQNPYLLFVSGNRSEKNVFRALEAYILLKKEHMDLPQHLVITGVNEPFQVLLKRFAYKLGVQDAFIKQNIHLFDYVATNDLENLYHYADVFLYPSKSEGFGIPLIEALLHHTPCVSSNLTSIPEVLGACNVYVNPYRVESIKEGLYYMLNHRSFYQGLLDTKIELVLKQADFDKKIFFNLLLTI